MPLGPLRPLQGGPPGVGGLVGVAGPEHVQPRDGAQRGQVLDRLVGGPVLAEADRVVGPDVDDRRLHQRGQPDRRAHVVGEHQERAAVGPGRAVQRDAVEDRAHGVLADPEVQGAPVRLGRPTSWWRSRSGPNESAPSIVVLLLSARSAEPPHSSGSTSASALSTSPDALRVATPLRVDLPGGQRLLPADRQVAAEHPVQQLLALRLAGGPVVVGLRPGLVRLPAAVDHLPGVLEHLVGDLEGLLRVEAEDLLDRGHLVVAERGAVRLAGVHLASAPGSR